MQSNGQNFRALHSPRVAVLGVGGMTVVVHWKAALSHPDHGKDILLFCCIRAGGTQGYAL